MWQGALTKYKQRIDSIALAHEATSLSVASYNSKALPTLGYIAQLVPPPPKHRRLEVCALNRVLHLATNSFFA